MGETTFNQLREKWVVVGGGVVGVIALAPSTRKWGLLPCTSHTKKTGSLGSSLPGYMKMGNLSKHESR